MTDKLSINQDSLIQEVIVNAHNNVARKVNGELLDAYWNIGRIVCEYEQSVPDRADYGKRTLKELAYTLTQEFGRGFSRSNIQNMRLFYLAYEKMPDTVWQIELVALL